MLFKPQTAALSSTEHGAQIENECTCTSHACGRDPITSFRIHKNIFWHRATWVVMYRTTCYMFFSWFSEVSSPDSVIFYTYYTDAFPQLSHMFHGIILKKWACFLFLLCPVDKCISSVTCGILSSGSTAEIGLYITDGRAVQIRVLCIFPFKKWHWDLGLALASLVLGLSVMAQIWKKENEPAWWRVKEKMGGSEEGGKWGVEGGCWRRSSCREKEMSRWEGRRGGNPSGKQKVLSDRSGLCNRIGAFWECVWVCGVHRCLPSLQSAVRCACSCSF